MVKIIKELVSSNVVNNRSYGYGNIIRYIVIHETANVSKGADAKAHSRLQRNMNPRQASWHYQVDDKHAIQSFDNRVKCWHAGSANSRSISIEICVNRDGDFNKAVNNAAKLTKMLMDKYNIPLSRVKQHSHFTGKNCPTNLRNGSKGINWNDFLNRVSNGPVSSSKPSVPSQPSSKPSSRKWTKVDGNWNGQALRLWQYGEPVRQLQQMLSNKYFYPNKGTKNNGVDGYFGRDTEDAVRRFQTMTKGLTVDGVPGKATYEALGGKSNAKPSKPKLKSNAQIVKEVKAGKWGNNPEREKRLNKAGYNAKAIQDIINKGNTPKPKLKSNAQIVKEVKAGKWGNNPERERRLNKAGYNAKAIQNLINKGNRKSNNQIAREVLAGKWGNGTARQNALKKAGYNHSAIQKIVNRLA